MVINGILVEQFNIISKRDVVFSSKEFSTEITLTDNYYFVGCSRK